MAIGTKPICESDRKMHWFASENLFISHNNTLFHKNFYALSRKTIGYCKIPCSFENTCKKTPGNTRFLFFYIIKSNLLIWKINIFGNIIDVSNNLFYVLSREKIRMKKFSVVSKIYTKNGSKIEIFYFFFNINVYYSFKILYSCKSFISFL